MKLNEQCCANCKFARSNKATEADAKLSCRYHPPMPTFNDHFWRTVPSDFWCGQWEEGGIWREHDLRPLDWRPDQDIPDRPGS